MQCISDQGATEGNLLGVFIISERHRYRAFLLGMTTSWRMHYGKTEIAFGLDEVVKALN
jgi:hypothetical protein